MSNLFKKVVLGNPRDLGIEIYGDFSFSDKDDIEKLKQRSEIGLAGFSSMLNIKGTIDYDTLKDLEYYDHEYFCVQLDDPNTKSPKHCYKIIGMTKGLKFYPWDKELQTRLELNNEVEYFKSCLFLVEL